MIAVGQVLSEKYRLVRLVGDGGMGSVYEAEHLMLGTHVAIKVLHPELARRAGLAERFMQEARVSAQIRSPHVVSVHDVDRTPDGEAFLVMELLEGEPLSSRLDRERRLDEALACDITSQLLEALSAAHVMGVVHRDLKPENVFLTNGRTRPFVKVIDFGIAKLRHDPLNAPAHKNLTAAGVMMGTAEYMAPEQAYSAAEVDARADIYSVGVMLYEMLAGKRPVSGDDARIIAIKVERGEGTPLVHAAPGVRPELAGLVHRAISSHPDLRFQSAAEMMTALAALAESSAQPGGRKQETAALPGGPAPARAPAVQSPASAVPKAGTQMAAPLGPAYTPGAGAPQTQMRDVDAPAAAAPREGAAYPAAQYPTPMRPPSGERRARGRSWGYFLVPLIVGAGAVGGYVFYTNNYPSSPTPAPLVAPTTTLNSNATAPTAIATGPASPPTALTATPPLTPPLTPAIGPGPHVTPAPGQGAPSAAPAGSIVPFGMPSGFPSAFPFPIPSNGAMPPFQIPSGFPTAFPPFGVPPTPAPPQGQPVPGMPQPMPGPGP